MKLTSIIAATLAVTVGLSAASGSIAATMAAKPATKVAAAKPAAVTAAPPSTLACQIGKDDTKVTVQIINTGTKDVAAGTVFSYTVLGPKTKTPGSYKLAWALGPKKTINLTKPMDPASVTSCTPSA